MATKVSQPRRFIQDCPKLTLEDYYQRYYPELDVWMRKNNMSVVVTYEGEYQYTCPYGSYVDPLSTLRTRPSIDDHPLV